jgi:class 3 adenylate cyclase/tetratricopeptide (TPR) repeat protein
VSSCPACGHENPPDARFCNACGAGVGPDHVPREQRKVVTVLFCDVTGSTELGERLDPEAFRLLLARYFDRMRAIVERHGGSVEKFIGDAVMAVFGVPALHEDDAIRGLRAAVEMRNAFAELQVSGRIGLATGEVVTGTSERLVTGDAVNVAARLEQAAQPGEILVAAETAALAGAGARLEPIEPLALKGKAEPVVSYRLLSIAEPRDRVAATPMVGRTRQRTLLEDMFGAVQSDRACHLFTIVGAAGVGKSRLVGEFLEAASGAVVVRSRCLSYGEGITYWPVVEILKQLPDRPNDAVAAAAIATLLGESDAPTTPDSIAWATRKTLEQAALRSPLICVFDDIHWGEPALLDLIEHIADFSRDAPILLLCVARPELMDRRPNWAGGKLNATTSLLERLSADETDALISHLVAKGQIDQRLRQRVAEAAEGNPLFLEEMIAMIVAEPSADLEVPPTIKAVLAARLDQLDVVERAVLERGAVEGKVFHQGAVEALLPDRQALAQQLQELVRKELIRSEPPVLTGQAAFRFRHQLIRDVAYEGLPKGQRAELHIRFAEWLEAHGQGLVELDEVLGYHLEQACMYRDELGLDPDPVLEAAARDRLVAAGRRALTRQDDHAAAVLLGRGSRLAGSTFDAVLEVDLADALFSEGNFEAALRSLEAATERARRQGNRPGELCVRIKAGDIRVAIEPEGAIQSVLAIVDHAMPEFERAGDQFGLFLGACIRAEAKLHYGRLDAAAVGFDQALAHARATGLPHLEARMVGWRVAARKDGSMPVTEFLSWLETLPSYAGFDDWIGGSQAVALAMCGEAGPARAQLSRLQAQLEERGATLALGVHLGFNVTETELVLGAPQAAVDAGVRGCEMLDQLGERSWCSTAAAFVARAYYALDRLDEADSWADRSAALGATDDVSTQLLARLVRAKVFARRGAAEDAARTIGEAMAMADGIENTQYQAIAYADLSEVFRLTGRPDESRAALVQALECARRKGIRPMAQRLEAMLAAE